MTQRVVTDKDAGVIIDGGKLQIDNDKFCEMHKVNWFDVAYVKEGWLTVERYVKEAGWYTIHWVYVGTQEQLENLQIGIPGEHSILERIDEDET